MGASGSLVARHAVSIGRIGALAVALGIGYALAEAPAQAQPADSSSTEDAGSAPTSSPRASVKGRAAAGLSKTGPARESAARSRPAATRTSAARAVTQSAAATVTVVRGGLDVTALPQPGAAAPEGTTPNPQPPVAAPLMWTATASTRREARRAAASYSVAAPSLTTSAGRTASARAAQVGDPGPTHVLLIGTDGTNLSKILEYAYDDPDSGFRIIMDESVTGATSIIGHTTISGPSWSTVLTGAWDSKTGVINNLFDPGPYTPWPTVFNQLEYYEPAIDTAVFADWKYINDIAGAGSYPVGADDNVFVEFSTSWEDTDDLVVDATIAQINATSSATSTFMFSYQVAVDEAGHAFGGESTQYRDAVINTSDNIARIVDAVDAWEAANPGEEWTIIVTTDHGHQPSVGFGHGFQSPAETSSFVTFDLEGDAANDGKQNLGYTIADITPTIVSLFGAPNRADFDGVPLQTRASGIVDPVDLKQSLSDAISMYGYPDIATDVALSVRTVFTSIPYFIDGFVTSITGQLQSIVDADIFLISTLAGVAEYAVQFFGGVLVGTTQAVARVVATLTGAGVIPPADAPLPPPAAGDRPVCTPLTCWNPET